MKYMCSCVMAYINVSSDQGIMRHGIHKRFKRSRHHASWRTKAFQAIKASCVKRFKKVQALLRRKPYYSWSSRSQSGEARGTDLATACGDLGKPVQSELPLVYPVPIGPTGPVHPVPGILRPVYPVW